MGTHTCIQCGETKPIEQFTANKTRKDGYTNDCLDCNRSRNRKWKKENHEKMKASQNKYRLNNLEKNAKAKRRWEQEHPDAVVQHSHRKRLRKMGNGVFELSAKDKKWLERQPCFACGTYTQLQLEHLVPVARGGTHSIGNLVRLCKSCNTSKGMLTWSEWKYSTRPKSVALLTGELMSSLCVNIDRHQLQICI